MTLSVIICSVNDQEETLATIQSIRATAPPEVEIVLVDDCSGSPISADWRFANIPNLKLIRNRHRCGCGPSRHIGALSANGEWLLITDSHVRFTEGWFDCARVALKNPKTIHCSTCLGLDSKHMDVNAPAGEYNGATFNWHGPDRQGTGKMQTLECVWLRKDEWPEDGAEIPGLMGAGYVVSKGWFLHLGACRFLHTWGQDELMLSMKSWLAGGEVRMLRSVRIGHKFPLKGELKWFALPTGSVQWNKIMAAYSLFPPDVAERLVEWVLTPDEKKDAPDVQAAKVLMMQDWYLVAQEMAYNKTIFVRDAKWLADRFNLPLP